MLNISPSESDVGAIVGAAVGGVVAVIFIVAVTIIIIVVVKTVFSKERGMNIAQPE